MTVGRVVQVSVSPGGVPKLPVPSAKVGRLGLEGDKHNPRSGHGGPSRAVCLMSLEVIEKLQSEGHAVEPGSLGENLTIEGLQWERLEPGDHLKVGEVELELTEFTTPCTKVGRLFVDRDITRILHTRNPGEARLYARVLTPGVLAAGMAVEHISLHAPSPR